MAKDDEILLDDEVVLGEKKKILQNSKFVLAAIIMFVIGVSVIIAMVAQNTERKSRPIQKPETTLFRETNVTGLEKVTQDVDTLKRRFNDLEKQNKALEDNLKSLTETIGGLKKTIENFGTSQPLDGQDTNQDSANDQETLNAIPGGGAPVPSFQVGDNLSAPIPLPKPLENGNEVPPALANFVANQDGKPSGSVKIEPEQPPVEIMIKDENGSGFDFNAFKKKAKEDFDKQFNTKKEKTVFMPAGSMFSAVLLTGVDMPTSAATEKSPVPVVFRVKREAILPNFASVDVRECFLLGSGYGQMSSERAIIRGEALACVTEKGNVIETAFNAFIVGTDGKVGIPGRLVSKQGALIARSLLAGVFSGIAGGSTSSLVPSLNIYPGTKQLWQDPDFEKIVESGAKGGIRTVAQSIADFYLKMAQETFPVIEISAGQGVTVVVTTGSSLPLKGTTQLQALENSQGGEVLQPIKTSSQAKQQAPWESGKNFGTPPKETTEQQPGESIINSITSILPKQ